jgi:hypothetical protein
MNLSFLLDYAVKGLIGLVTMYVGIKMPLWLNSAKKKNQATEIAIIAEAIVALVIANNPNLPWQQVMKDAITTIKSDIEGISSKVAERAIADALYKKGVIGAKVEANK